MPVRDIPTELLGDFVYYGKYAKYREDLKRRESWEEAWDRVYDMHAKKYDFANRTDDLPLLTKVAITKGKQKKLLGSQRVLQFAGEPIFQREMRAYNCQYSYCDRPRFFAEILFLLLCGSGCGFSVQSHHVKKLPKLISQDRWHLRRRKEIFVEDSIEGWADAVNELINAYLPSDPSHGEYEPEFNYMLIRPKGSRLSSGGKAPGYKPLETALERVRKILINAVANSDIDDELTTLECYDIVLHLSDAVLSGGVRRSACIALFDINDEEMLNSKTGNWFVDNPQRARANNSVVCVQDEVTYEDFENVIKRTKEFGDPGFVFVKSREHGTNPCQPKWAPIITPDGLRTLADVEVGDVIWSKEGWTTVTAKWSTGVKEVYKYRTTSGVFYGTDTHRVVSNGEKIEVGLAESIDVLAGPDPINDSWFLQDIVDGLVLGDGTWHKANAELIYLNIGEDDQEYFESEISEFVGVRYGSDRAYKINTQINISEVGPMWERRIPKRYFESSTRLRSVLRGIFSANGSIAGDRVTLKTSSFGLVEDIQLALSSLGIRSYYTTNKSKEVEFDNGTYLCKQSYDVNITSDRAKFSDSIGFIHKYKTDKLNEVIGRVGSGKTKKSYDIISIELVSTEEVFDITVDNNSHTYWTGNCNVSNCGEVSLIPVLITDPEGNVCKEYTLDMLDNQDKYKALGYTYESGWQSCNLCTIDMSKVATTTEFYFLCEYATVLGTLQAGYTNAGYLGITSQKIIERESLLGISMTGIMENPAIALNPQILRGGAAIVVNTNKEISSLLGIPQAARTTTVKPEGTGSLVLGTSSGIHAHHHKRFLRRVQNSLLDPVYQYFKEKNPKLCEKSVWNTNTEEEVITFPVSVPPESVVKGELTAEKFLENVRIVQENWVLPGTALPMSVEGATHNVSNTCEVKDSEWEKVTKILFDNRRIYSGVSLLGSFGDYDVPQAPLQRVYCTNEIKEMCTEEEYSIALDIYTNPDKDNLEVSKEIKKIVGYIAVYEHWKYLRANLRSVDYSRMIETDDNTKQAETLACGSGGCELV